MGGLLLGSAVAASAAAVGGGYWAAVGEGRISVRQAPQPRMDFTPNLRFDFDGAGTDVEGTGTVLAYDAAGQNVLDDFPFAWTTKKGASFKADLLNGEFEEFLAARIAEASGEGATVVLTRATAKGRLHPRDGTLKVTIQARGEAAIGSSLPGRLKARLKVK